MRDETETVKEERRIGYYFEDGVYHLIDFGNNEVLEIMNEVAFMFDYNDCKDGESPALLMHGLPIYVNISTRKLRKLYIENGQANIAASLIVIQGKIPIGEIDKMLSITGYIYEEALIIR